MTPEEEKLYTWRHQVLKKGGYFHPDCRVERSSNPKASGTKWEYVMPIGFGQTKRFASVHQVMEHLGLEDSSQAEDSTGKSPGHASPAISSSAQPSQNESTDKVQSQDSGAPQKEEKYKEGPESSSLLPTVSKLLVEYEDDDEDEPAEDNTSVPAYEAPDKENCPECFKEESPDDDNKATEFAKDQSNAPAYETSSSEDGQEYAKPESPSQHRRATELSDDQSTAPIYESSGSEDDQKTSKAESQESKDGYADTSSGDGIAHFSESPKAKAESASRPSGPATPNQAPPERPRSSYSTTSSSPGNNQLRSSADSLETDQSKLAKGDLDHLEDFIHRTEKAISDQQSESESMKDSIREHAKLLNAQTPDLEDHKTPFWKKGNEVLPVVKSHTAKAAMILMGLALGLVVQNKRKSRRRPTQPPPAVATAPIRPPQWTARFF